MRQLDSRLLHLLIGELGLRRLACAITGLIFSLAALACCRGGYVISRVSPTGLYRVSITGSYGDTKGTARCAEYAAVRILRGEETIYSYEWENSDEYEPSFRETAPIIEWVGDSVIRMGADRSDQPFSDEVIISNKSHEVFREGGVVSSRFESFHFFDLEPGAQVTLRTSPEILGGSSQPWHIGYGGTTETGKTFTGSVERKARHLPDDGPLKFQITIGDENLEDKTNQRIR